MNEGITELDTTTLPRSRLFPAIAVVLLCLVGTVGTAFFAQKEIASREQALYDGILDSISVRTIRVSESYEQRLLGMAGFVAGSDEITLQDWSNYIAAIQSQDLAPEIWDVGLFDVVAKSSLPNGGADQSTLGASTDSESFEAEGEDVAVVARFVTLVSGRTIQSSGRNVLNDLEVGLPLRRAMATGETSLSLVMRNAYRSAITAGYALIAPATTRQPELESAVDTLVFLSFSTDQLLDAIMRDAGFPVCVDLYDGETMSPETLVSEYCRGDNKIETPYYEDIRVVTVGGRALTLCLKAEQGFYIEPLAVPFGIIIPLGLIITALLGGILWYEATTREQARNLAQSITSDLEISRNRYDRVVRVAGVGFWERDYQSDKIIWSEQMWALSGLDPNTHLTGDSEHNIEMIVHPEDQDRIFRALTAHIKLDEPYSEEFRFVRPDDSVVWIYSTANTDRDEQGNPIRTIGSVTDITPRKKEEERRRAKENELKDTISELTRSQKKLDAALRDAEAASRAKSTFLSTMSHELRTPLNAILGFSEVIRDNLLGRESTRSYEDYAGDIHSSGEHLLDLINDILDLAKVEEGQITLTPKDLVLNTVIASTLNLMQPRATAKQHSLTAALPDDAITIHADFRALKQILFNLVSNAIQFTEPGGEIEVTVAGQDSGAIEICVSDTGIGIAPADIGRIFNPFERIIEPGKPESEGTGLGLAVVKSLVELQNGSLNVESTPGKGSTFCVSLPAA
ncbi:MAG: PAS domain-containing protein [Rhodospirillaceae bacterium]|nr:PAS domain-containing protein [Rhodospirillaceae bacterium]